MGGGERNEEDVLREEELYKVMMLKKGSFKWKWFNPALHYTLHFLVFIFFLSN